MKRFTILCVSVLLSLGMVDAINYNEVTITSGANRLVGDRPATGALLPADFSSVIFDGSTPRMDRVFVFMTMPAGFTDYTITDPTPIVRLNSENKMELYNKSAVLKENTDWLFSYVKSGSQYVLDRLPFDPTTRALDSIMIPEATTAKVYITGHVSGKLSAQLPEEVGIAMRPYMESLREMLNEKLIVEIKNAIIGMGLESLTLNKNTEGFFWFTGYKSSNLELYLEDLNMAVQDKANDFLGGIVAGKNLVNLMGIDRDENPDNFDLATFNAASNADKQTMLESMDSEGFMQLSNDQLQAVIPYMTADQVENISPLQLCKLLGKSDISEVLSMADISTQLYTIFGDADKATRAGNTLNNLQNTIMSTISSQLSTSALSSALLEDGFGKLFSSLVQGSASPFAFSSNSQNIESQAFNLHIHSKGVNTITGGAEAAFSNVGDEMDMLASGFSSNPNIHNMITDLGTIFEAMIKFTSAPLAVRPSAKVVDAGNTDAYNYTCTRLTFDDVWTDGSHTNALLQMPVVGAELGAPSIDLGTPNGQAIFNGGRYRFHTPVSNKKKNMFYVATMAICYRELAVTMPIANSDITYAGIGTSVGWGPSQDRSDLYRNVVINDGTFYTYSAEAWKDKSRGDNAVDAVGNGWYKHYTDLRLPYNTSILGGTFPYDTYVYRCDAAAEQGTQPVYIVITNPGEVGEQQWLTPLCERKEMFVDDLADTADPLNSNGTVKVTTPQYNEVYISSGTKQQREYYTSSLTPDEDDKLYVYETGTCVIDRNYVRNYVTALAPFGEYHMHTKMMSMGGDVEVKSLYQDRVGFPQKNGYLLYTQLGYYTFTNAGVNLGGLTRTLQDEFQIDRAKHHNFKNTGTDTNASGQGIMTTTDKTGVIFSEITNEDSYKIEYGIYAMVPAKSDEWMMVSMPFDVANVYILETTEEQGNSAWTADEWDAFFKRQGEADGNMAQALVTSVLPDIFSGRGSGVLQPLDSILKNQTERTLLSKLKHYTPKNGTDYDPAEMAKAHYYLREQLPDIVGTTKWEQKDTVGAYGYNWTYAPEYTTPTYLTETYEDPECTDFYDCDYITAELKYVNQNGELRPAEEQRVVMKKDSVYSLYFPGAGKRFWDYKYLIFEGYGPQRISGKSVHAGFHHPSPDSTAVYPGEGYIALQGNTTFGNAVKSNISAEHPLFFVEKQQTGTFPTGSITYNFVANDTESQRILPTSVYMVSHDNKASIKETVISSPDVMWRDGEVESNGVPTLADNMLTAWTEKGIYMYSFLGQDVEVYTIDGRELWSGRMGDCETRFLPAPAGVYVIKTQTGAMKVVNE